MAKPYSEDLRRKLIEAIELDGLKKSEASQLFHLSRNTIDLWLKRRKETGNLQAKSTAVPSQRQKITDWEKFRDFVTTHRDKTQIEMAELWGGVSSRTLSRALKPIGFTRKKSLWLPPKGRSETHRISEASP
jgi:transposase